MKKKTTIHIISICMLILSLTLATAYIVSPKTNEKLEETTTTIYLSPTDIPASPINENFTVDLNVSDVTNLYTWVIGLSWNSSVLNCVNLTWDYSWFGPQIDVIPIPGIINNTAGKFDAPYAASLITAGVNGSGTIAQIEFLVVGHGTTSIDILVDTLLNSSGFSIQYSVINGSFTLPLPHGPTAVKTHTPSEPQTNEPVTFNASASLPGSNGAANVSIANYTWDFGDSNVTTVTDPVIYHVYGAADTYLVSLTVTCEDDPTLIANSLTSDSISQSITVIPDTTPPTISSVTQDPAKTEVDADEAVTVTATVTDTSGVHTVLLNYSTDNSTFTSVTMTLSTGDNYAAQIPGQAAGTYVSYKIFANDTAGNSDETTLHSYRVKTPQPPSNLWLWIVIGVVIVVIVIVAAVYLMRRKPA